MNEYELLFIVQPNADEAHIDALNARIGEFAAASSGELLVTRNWGHRRLAFPIRKQTSGSYVLMRLRLTAPAIEELQLTLRLNEEVLRFLVVRAEEVPALSQ